MPTEEKIDARNDAVDQVLHNTCFDHRGIKINITSTGWRAGEFTATIDGDVVISKPSLDEIKTEIDRVLSKRAKRRVSLPVCAIMQPDSFGRKTGKDPAHLVTNAITGLNRNSREFQYEHPIPEGYDLRNVVPDTPENRARAVALIDARNALRKIEDEHNKRHIGIRGHGRIDVEDYDGVLSELEANYKDSLDVDSNTETEQLSA